MSQPERIGPYVIEYALGRGGMGVVYAARDERLSRRVALKTILPPAGGPDGEAAVQAERRFRREARAAAAVSHPNVCQIYEVGEDGGLVYLAMELLDGEPLSARIARGPIPVPEALQVGAGILAALQALHAHDIVHRDLKPSNVFLTPHGVKLLDFGLARQGATATDQTGSLLTQPGAVMGTPRYMSPEQLRGETAEAHSDIFAVAAILFEMLTARPAFAGRTTAEVCHATLYEQPPALTGSPAVAALDLVVRRGLAKRAEDRPSSAAAMAEELRRIARLEDSGEVPRARLMARLVALPFRMLRPDADTDFLAFSVPDAVASALTGLGSLVVRSSAVAARYAAEVPDLARIAAEAEVDVVLFGTLLRAGEKLRMTAQLVEAPSGDLVWSHTATVALTDVFQLQDDLVDRIVSGLSIPLTAREERRLHGDVPATPAAYEYYLRGNRLAGDSASWDLARDLYERCVQEDPRFAPAWARLGRMYRVIAKFRGGAVWDELQKSERAFRRALELNPDLPVAHNLYTHFEVEAGRAREAMLRLLERAQGGSADPELFAGLVTATRYCGLLAASLAADAHARRLDPEARTSVSYTHWLRGEYAQAIRRDPDPSGYMRLYSMGESAAPAPVRQAVQAARARQPAANASLDAYLHALDGDGEAVRRDVAAMLAMGFRDPEGLYFAARALARTGRSEEALGLLRQVVEGGFHPAQAIAGDRWLAPLAADSRFAAVLSRAGERTQEAADAWRGAGGSRVLGISDPC